MRSHKARGEKLKALGSFHAHDPYYKEKFKKVLENLAVNHDLALAPDSMSLEVDPETMHLYIQAKGQNYYELFRDFNYQILGKVMHEEHVHTGGYVTFKGPNICDEFVFEIKKDPES